MVKLSKTVFFKFILLIFIMFSFQSVTKVQNFLMAFIIILLMFLFSKKTYDKIFIINFSIISCFVILLLFFQIFFIRDIKIETTIYTYLNLYIGIISFFFIKNFLKKDNSYYFSVVFVLLFYNINTIFNYYFSNYLRGISSIGSSINYLAALNIISIPFFINKFFTSQNKFMIRFNFIVLTVISSVVLISGSRVAIITFLFCFLSIVFFLVKNKLVNLKIIKKNIFFVFIILLIFILLFINIGSEWFMIGITRIVNSLKSKSIGNDRIILIKKTIEKFIKSNVLLGKGDSFLYNIEIGSEVIKRQYPHNFILEILLHSGLIGLSIFFLYYILLFNYILIYSNKNKVKLFLSILIIFLGYLISFAQPFLISGLLFNFLIINNIFSITNEVN